MTAAERYLAASISLGGFDSAEVLDAHSTMADILLGTGRIPEGLKHLRASQFLMEFMAGKNYSGISSTYYRMGSHYYDAGRLEDALRFYGVAATRRSEDRMFDCLIARNSAGVLARLGQFKPAFDYEKKAYQLYATFLGEEHDATKSCSNTLIVSLSLLRNEFHCAPDSPSQPEPLQNFPSFAATYETRCGAREKVENSGKRAREGERS